MISTRLTHGSLFSGIGGPEVAAEMMGWENVFHCDINPFGREVLIYWYPNSKSYEDITKTDFTEWRGKIDVLTGGFPCQPFSVAGQRKGADDNRYLWPHMLRAIREIRPTWVVGENVAGILTMVQPGKEVEVGCQASLFGEDNRKRILLRQEYVVETICKDIEREGYSVQPLLIPACAVGAPHRRDRVWFVAHTNSNGGQEKTERKFKQAEKNNEQSESLFHSGTSSYRSNARAEDVRQERENTILSDKIATHSYVYGHTPCGTCEGLERRGCGNNGESEEREQSPQWDNGFHGFSRNVTDTGRNGCRFGKNKQKQFAKCKGTADLGIIREDGASTDTNGEDGSVVAYYQCSGSKGKCEQGQGETQLNGRDCEEVQSRWQDFPTQPPVCGRDDGLPFNVGDLTIPFTRWRQEAVKAYGNAIVPQVIYEIFRAIEYIGNEYHI